MSNIDWSQLVTKRMKEEATALKQYEELSVLQEEWRLSELSVVAEQLLALEDDDPNREPGTERQWRDYRIQVRAWKEGAEGFPLSENRPTRPE